MMKIKLNKFIINLCLFFVSLLMVNLVHAQLTPLLVPEFDSFTKKYTGKSLIADSIDNQAPNQSFRDRTYYYDLALDSTGKAYVLYAQPKPLTPNSSEPVNFDQEKTDIILAVETQTGWDKQILTTNGVFQPTGLQIKSDSNDVLHLIYIRTLTKIIGEQEQELENLMYRKIEDGVVSDEFEVGNISTANFAGLGGWRTRMAISPDNKVYMIRESGSQDLTQPFLNFLTPGGNNNWTASKISGLPDSNWYRLGNFIIDSDGHAHILFGDFAYNQNGNSYTADGSGYIDHLGFHNLHYAYSITLDAENWTSSKLDTRSDASTPAVYNDQFWSDLALDEKNSPSVAVWLWPVGTQYPGHNSSTVFLKKNTSGQWTRVVTTRKFENLSYRPNGELAGMGPGIVNDQYGWHGVWDNSHPRPFEHEFERGGIIYRFSSDGNDWSSYDVIAPFSAEGYCKTIIDSQNRLNVLVLGDHTDTQLYLLRYQLPDNNLMELFPDRKFYYLGEDMNLHAQVRSGAVGDFYVVAISNARPEINQPQEIWQLNIDLTWQKIGDLSQLSPMLSLTAGVNFSGRLTTITHGKEPFDKPDTDYYIFSVVSESGKDLLSGQWVTPLSAYKITANKTLP